MLNLENMLNFIKNIYTKTQLTTYKIQQTFITTSAASEIIATTTIYDDLRIGIIQ